MILKKSVSPIIVVILLILVSLVIIDIILTWGKSFTQGSISKADTIYQESDLTGLILVQRTIGNKILFINTSNSINATIIGYKILTLQDGYSFLGTRIDINSTDLNFASNALIEIVCYPSQSFDIELYTDQNEYIRVHVTPDSYTPTSCFDYYGLIGWWPFDEETGEIVKDKYGANDGIVENTTSSAFWISGVYKPTLDGINDYVNLGSSSSLNPGANDFSFSGWVKIDTNHMGGIISKGENFKVEVTPEAEVKVTLMGDDWMNMPTSADNDGTYIYIADKGQHRIVKRLLSDMSYISELGVSGVSGSTIGYFTQARGVCVDDNYIYIADSGNNRIVRAIKSTMAWDTNFGSSGSGINQFSSPRGVACDDNYLYVADYSNKRIVKLNKSDLSWDSNFGSSGSGLNQFNGPYGLDVDANYLYVSDSSNHRIVKLNKSDLSWDSNIGSSGSGNDQFSSPYGVYVDDNYLYVADYGNNRIVKRLKSDLSYISKLGSTGADENEFREVFGVTGYGDYLYIVDYGNARIVKLNKSDLSWVWNQETYGFGNDQLEVDTSGVATDDDYIYIADTYNHRIIKRDRNSYEYLASIGGPTSGTGDDQFNLPIGLAVDGTYLYVADYSNSRIVKRSKSDLFYDSKVGTYGTGNDQFRNPRGVSVDDTYLYVADYSNSRIVKRLKSDLSYVSKLGSSGSGTNQFNGPWDVCVGDTYVFVADTGNDRVVKLDKNLTWIGTIGSSGSGADQFNYIIKIDCDDNTYFYVYDYSNVRMDRRLQSDMSLDANLTPSINTLPGLHNNAIYAFDVDNNELFLLPRSDHGVYKLDSNSFAFKDKYLSASTTLFSSTLLDTDWHHVAVVMDHMNTLKIYIDGTLDATADISKKFDNLKSNDSMYLGRYNYNYLDGGISDVRLFSKALSATEVADIYESTLFRYS